MILFCVVSRAVLSLKLTDIKILKTFVSLNLIVLQGFASFGVSRNITDEYIV